MGSLEVNPLHTWCRAFFLIYLSFLAYLFHTCVSFILCCCKQPLSITPYGMKDGPGHPQISNVLVLQSIKRTGVSKRSHPTPRLRFSVALLGFCIFFWTHHYKQRNENPMLAWQGMGQSRAPCNQGCKTT